MSMPSPPDPLFIFASLLQLAAALAAAHVARRRGAHWPIAVFLFLMVGANVAHELVRLLVLVPARAAGGDAPFTGWVRVAGHVATALGLLWPCGLVGLAGVVFRGERPWGALGVWGALSLVLAATYPATRGPFLAHVLFGVEITAATMLLIVLVAWFLKLGRNPEKLTEVLSGTQIPPEFQMVVFLTMLELATLLVWREHAYNGWWRAQTVQAVMYAGMMLRQLTWR